MKLLNKILMCFCALSTFCACSDFLDIKDESAINPGIWDSEQSAMLYVNNIYQLCLPKFGGEDFAGTGVSKLSDETTDVGDLLLGTLATGKEGTLSAVNYQPIRYINIGFQNMEKSSLTGTARDNILGQFYFFRAWQHWKMVLVYGGIPYMKNVVDFNSEGDILNAPRNKTSECIEYIKEDLNKAIEFLPSSWVKETDYGRVTKATAASLLGRILLFYASPQFNPTNDINRWKAAYDANLKAEEICLRDNYGLFDVNTPVTEQWPSPTDINKIFTTEQNKEILFVRIYDTAGENVHSYEESVRTGQITGKADSPPSNCPTINLMKAFPMKDGTPYSEADLSMDFYKDRDPRFYSTIAYNGSYFPLGGDNNRRQWTYTGGEGTTVTSANITPTGFYCRKMVNTSITDLAKTTTDWVEMRYAEVLLNLAECAFEVGETEKGYTCLKQLRERAGIESGVDGYYGLKSFPGSLIELVMNERLIELAFEGKRFHDLRRRNMFTHDLGSYTKKMNGQKKKAWGLGFNLNTNLISKTEFEKIRNNLSIDDIYKYMTVKKTTAGPTAKGMNYKCYITEEELKADPNGDVQYNYNFFDISDAILTRSPAVKQTLGWPHGEFNPFE